MEFPSCSRSMIPILGLNVLTGLQDNIATTPKLGLPTTCGSLALVGSKPRRNAAIVDRVGLTYQKIL